MDLLTTAEVSAEYKIPEATLRFYRHKGIGPKSFRMGGRRVMYRRADCDAWLLEQINAERDERDKLVSLETQ